MVKNYYSMNIFLFMKMDMKLISEQQRNSDGRFNIYNIVFSHTERRTKLYLTNLIVRDDEDILSSVEASNLEEAAQLLFQEAINRLDNKDKSDFLGWPAYFVSIGMVESGGDNFFGWDPFVLNQVPQDIILKFARLYSERVREYKKCP